MNITVRNIHLAQELRLLAKIVPNKTPLPVLSYVHINASDGKLVLETTDLTLALRASCPATVQTAGSVLLPAKKTLELLEQLPDVEINIEVDSKQATITAGTFKSRFQVWPTPDFPGLAPVSGDVATVPANALHRLIDRASFAISEKVQKYVLDGALLSLNGPVMAMVATDGQRLTVTTASRSDTTVMNVLVPSKTLEMLTLILGDGDVEISSADNHIFFVIGQRTLISRLIDGHFPKYDKIIPRDNNKHISVDRILLAAALRRVAVVADKHTSVVFEAEPGTLRLTSQSVGLGDAHESLLAVYDGEPIKVCASGKHVLDFLDKASEKNVTIALKTSQSPMLWTDGADFLNVILVRKQ